MVRKFGPKLIRECNGGGGGPKNFLKILKAGAIGMQSALAFASTRPGLTEKVGIAVGVFAFHLPIDSFRMFEYPFHR